MDQPQLVRIATPDDIEPLFWHLMNDYAPVNTIPVPISDVAVLDTVKACCTGDHAIAGVVESRSRGIVASVGIRAAEPWFSKQAIVNQIWLFVSPAARGGLKLERELFQFVEWHRQDMAKKLGYDIVCENTVLSRDRLPAKTRLWRRYGEQIGSVFWTGGVNVEDKHERTDIDSGQRSGVKRLHRPRK